MLIVVRKLDLQVPSGREDSLHCPHPVVIVELTGELLRAESISCDNLDGQTPCFHKTKRVERNLSNHSIVWHHHCHSTKQHLGWGVGGLDKNRLTNKMAACTLRLSGSSDLPAYPGFMVTQTKQDDFKEMVVPSNTKVVR